MQTLLLPPPKAHSQKGEGGTQASKFRFIKRLEKKKHVIIMIVVTAILILLVPTTATAAAKHPASHFLLARRGREPFGNKQGPLGYVKPPPQPPPKCQVSRSAWGCAGDFSCKEPPPAHILGRHRRTVEPASIARGAGGADILAAVHSRVPSPASAVFVQDRDDFAANTNLP